MALLSPCPQKPHQTHSHHRAWRLASSCSTEIAAAAAAAESLGTEAVHIRSSRQTHTHTHTMLHCWLLSRNIGSFTAPCGMLLPPPKHTVLLLWQLPFGASSCCHHPTAQHLLLLVLLLCVCVCACGACCCVHLSAFSMARRSLSANFLASRSVAWLSSSSNTAAQRGAGAHQEGGTTRRRGTHGTAQRSTPHSGRHQRTAANGATQRIEQVLLLQALLVRLKMLGAASSCDAPG